MPRVSSSYGFACSSLFVGWNCRQGHAAPTLSLLPLGNPWEKQADIQWWQSPPALEPKLLKGREWRLCCIISVIAGHVAYWTVCFLIPSSSDANSISKLFLFLQLRWSST
jgi:hypothetical protein